MSIKLLIVDDEAAICELLSRHLRYLGYEVETATDGAEALTRLAEVRVDVVISDVKMPQMGGIELLGRIRDEYPMIRIIMMTGYVSQENVLECMQKGAEDCLFKPLQDLEKLEKAVQRAADSVKRWFSILAELNQLKSESSSG